MLPPPALITPPTQDVVTLGEAKTQLHVTGSTQDDLISAIISAAVNEFDPAGGGYLGRALRPQTWELRLMSFYEQGNSLSGASIRVPSCYASIELPCPPLIQVVSVKYDDVDGVEHTLTEGTDFKVIGTGTLGKQSISPLYGRVWPTTRYYPESVRIRFRSGYDSTTPPDPLPTPLKQAIHLAARYVYSLGERNLFQSMRNIAGVSETRWIVSDAASAVIRTAVESKISPYRVW